MGHTSRSMEDSGAEGDLNCEGLAQKVSEEKTSVWLETVLVIPWRESRKIYAAWLRHPRDEPHGRVGGALEAE